MEAGVFQFVTGVPQEDVVTQHLRVIDGVFQLHHPRTDGLYLILHRLDAGAKLRAAAALLLTVGGFAAGGVLGGGGRLGSRLAAAHHLFVAFIQGGLAVLDVKNGAGRGCSSDSGRG